MNTDARLDRAYFEARGDWAPEGAIMDGRVMRGGRWESLKGEPMRNENVAWWVELWRDILGINRLEAWVRDRLDARPVFDDGDIVEVDSPRYSGLGRVEAVNEAEGDDGVLKLHGEWHVHVRPIIGARRTITGYWNAGGYLHINAWYYPAEDVRPAKVTWMNPGRDYLEPAAT